MIRRATRETPRQFPPPSAFFYAADDYAAAISTGHPGDAVALTCAIADARLAGICAFHAAARAPVAKASDLLLTADAYRGAADMLASLLPPSH